MGEPEWEMGCGGILLQLNQISASILVPFPLGSTLSGFDHILQPEDSDDADYFENFSEAERLRLRSC